MDNQTNIKRLAEILLEHICAQEYAKSEKFFDEHKMTLEKMIEEMSDKPAGE